jgi:hypothetical protein
MLFVSACRSPFPFKIVKAGHADDEVEVSTAYKILVSGNRAYLANGEDGLRVYDISDPAAPKNIGHLIPDGGGKITLTDGIALAGTNLFTANYADGLRVLDVSHPENPVSIAHANSYSETNFGCIYFSVTVAGNLVYAACAGDGIRVYDVSDPTHPAEVAHRFEENLEFSPDPGPLTRAIALSGNHAYVANGRDGLHIYNVSSPTNLIPVGHVAENGSGGSAYDVAVSGNYAYVANSADGMRIYDVSNPTNIVNVGHTNNNTGHGRAVGVTVAGNYVLLANYFDGLRIYDVFNPSNPICVGHTENSIADENGWCAADVCLSGNYLLLANYHDVLRTYLLIPQLRMLQTRTNTVVSWPVPFAPGFTLQERTSRRPDYWQDVTNAPIVVSNRCQVIFPPASREHLFRLKYP